MKLDWSALDPKNRSLIALGALAAVLVGAGIGLEIVPRLAGRQAAEPEPPEGSFGPWPAPALPPVSLSAKPPAKPVEPSASPSPPPSYEKLVGLFEKAKEEPVAQKFAEEVKKDPDLKKDWEDFEKDQESDSPHQDLEGFAENIAGKAAFRQLVSKFAQDPSFKQIAGNIAAQIPELRGTIQRELAHADTATQLSAMAGSRARAALAGGRRSGGGGATGAVDMTGTGAAHLALAETDPGAGGARLSNAASAAGGQDASAAKAAAASSAASNPAGANGQSGAQPHEVSAQLPNPPDVGGGGITGPSFSTLCSGKKAHLTKVQCGRIEKILAQGKYSLWGACIMANLYKECAGMCVREPQLACTAPGCYNTCVSEIATGTHALTKATCALRCPDEPKTVKGQCAGTHPSTPAEKKKYCGKDGKCSPAEVKKMQDDAFDYANLYMVRFHRVKQCALPGLQIPSFQDTCQQYQKTNANFLAIMKKKHPKYKPHDRDKYLRQLELTAKCKKSPGPWGPH